MYDLLINFTTANLASDWLVVYDVVCKIFVYMECFVICDKFIFDLLNVSVGHVMTAVHDIMK